MKLVLLGVIWILAGLAAAYLFGGAARLGGPEGPGGRHV